MKNIQVIDGADNAMYSIYGVSEHDFSIIFPNDCDIEFVEDFIKRVGNKRAQEILKNMWHNEKDKKNISGIHGTLFYELSYKKKYYPTKKEEEMILSL